MEQNQTMDIAPQNDFNHVFETPDFRYFHIAAHTIISIGELVWQDDLNNMRPAREFKALGTQEETELEFAQKFIGVSLQASGKGEAYDIKVTLGGVFEFMVNKPFNAPVGTELTPETTDAGYLSNKLVRANMLGIAQLYRVSTENTRILVDVFSSIGNSRNATLFIASAIHKQLLKQD